MKLNKLILILLFTNFSILAQSSAELIDIGEGGVDYISKNGQYLCGSNYPDPPSLWSEMSGRIDVGNVEGVAYSVSNNGIAVVRFHDSSIIIGVQAVCTYTDLKQATLYPQKK